MASPEQRKMIRMVKRATEDDLLLAMTSGSPENDPELGFSQASSRWGRTATPRGQPARTLERIRDCRPRRSANSRDHLGSPLGSVWILDGMPGA
jgi:hypothetical protein